MRRYLIFFVASLSLFLVSVNGTSVAVALPVIISDFNASLVSAGWVLSIFQLISICAMPIVARMSEAFGEKRVFILFTLLFTIGSILSTFAPNIIWLILFRAIQGVGGGFLPVSVSIVADEFPDLRQRVVGLFTSVFPIGAIIGPNLGGWMVENWGWRSVFWFNIPFGIAVLVASKYLLRPDKPREKVSIDWVGAGLLVGFLSVIMLSLTELENQSGVLWVLAVFLLALGIGLLIVFLRWERSRAEPIINLELLRKRPFLAANIYNLIYGASAFGIFSLIPLYTVSIYGMSTLASGFILTPRSVAMMLTSSIVSFHLTKWGYRKPILIGTVLIFLSLILLALEVQSINIGGIHIGATAFLLIVMAITGIGVGISAPAANNACIELMPDRIATITGLRGMFRQMGGALNITIATLLLQSIDDIRRAFTIVFIALAVIMVLSIPAVFAMPECPRERRPLHDVQ